MTRYRLDVWKAFIKTAKQLSTKPIAMIGSNCVYLEISGIVVKLPVVAEESDGSDIGLCFTLEGAKTTPYRNSQSVSLHNAGDMVSAVLDNGSCAESYALSEIDTVPNSDSPIKFEGEISSKSMETLLSVKKSLLSSLGILFVYFRKNTAVSLTLNEYNALLVKSGANNFTKGVSFELPKDSVSTLLKIFKALETSWSLQSLVYCDDKYIKFVSPLGEEIYVEVSTVKPPALKNIAKIPPTSFNVDGRDLLNKIAGATEKAKVGTIVELKIDKGVEISAIDESSPFGECQFYGKTLDAISALDAYCDGVIGISQPNNGFVYFSTNLATFVCGQRK